MSPTGFLIWTTLLKSALLLVIILGLVSYTVYAERRVSALIQDRLGPNRVGWQGLLQPVADAAKLLLKENFTPKSANYFYFRLASKLAMVPPVLVLGVLPFGSSLFGVPMTIASVNVGALYVLAISSISVYGIVLAGWSSNSKYPFLGGIRSSSQMISYELSLALSLIPIFMLVGSLNLNQIVQYQIVHGWMIAPFWPQGMSLDTLLHPLALLEAFRAGCSLQRVLIWIPLFISFILFFISMFAETNRLPFDLPEAEQELIGGYHTEYSSMGFALFFLGEYTAMIAGAGVITTLFLGGWSLPLVPDGSHGWFWGLVNIAVFFAKVIVILFVFIWVRWTIPRFRYDQLMKLGWYFFFELAVANIFLAALILTYVKR
ncbi:MAG: NADH-quinone oxidoreductase subunit H [Verrucomicrobia bacterium]|jgi:NADH-quinone oxidoreductase subunit H|nr:MAG: NADH-quinone oxidoreductase subunit H [Verrucomicrobiota bacterium]